MAKTRHSALGACLGENGPKCDRINAARFFKVIIASGRRDGGYPHARHMRKYIYAGRARRAPRLPRNVGNSEGASVDRAAGRLETFSASSCVVGSADLIGGHKHKH
jgi:hypothetical protein